MVKSALYAHTAGKTLIIHWLININFSSPANYSPEVATFLGICASIGVFTVTSVQTVLAGFSARNISKSINAIGALWAILGIELPKPRATLCKKWRRSRRRTAMLITIDIF